MLYFFLLYMTTKTTSLSLYKDLFKIYEWDYKVLLYPDVSKQSQFYFLVNKHNYLWDSFL